MKGLTPAQAKVLEWVKKFIKENGYAPTRTEIAVGMGFASSNAAEEHLQALERKGAIRMTSRVARSIVVLDTKAAAPAWRAPVGTAS